MPIYCEFCDDLVNLKMAENGIIKYFCEHCDKWFKLASPILKSKSYKKNNDKMKKFSSIIDPIIPIVRMKCNYKKCDNYLIKYYREKDMSNVYLCEKCKTYWTFSGKHNAV